jgi:YesN/AraC family two-component response regulator
MKLRCLLIDDEPPALKVLASYIDSIKGLEIMGQCKNAIEALEVLQQKTVDVIFLDIKMPRILGTEFIKKSFTSS